MELSLRHDSKNLMLLDIFPQTEKTEDGNRQVLNILYKDLTSGKKYLDIIEKPKIPLYFTKQEKRDFKHNKGFSMYEDCYIKPSYPMRVNQTIAKEMGGKYEDLYKSLQESGNWREFQRMQMCPYVFGADIPVDVVYRRLWRDKYENDTPKKVTKGYLDIEVDTINCMGIPEDGEQPINAVSIIDETTRACYTFLLRNVANPQIKEFEDNIEVFIADLHESFDEFYGRLEYKIYMYDDEKELIKDIFRLINTLKMDFMLVWNGGGFDVPYIIGRINALGMDPDIIMTHPDFPIRKVYYKKDDMNFKVADKSDSLVMSSYTKWIDHMKLYAATRKGQSELRSHSLSYISQIELKDDKLDYSEVANMSTFPYENYAKFVKYNIKDVLLQYGIERRTSDLDGLYLRSYTTLTTYDKVFKQTVALRNRAYYELHLQNIILGVNTNVIIGKKSEEKFTGAIVGDPELNSHTGKKIFGKRSMYIYDNVIDFDFSSMYPHIILAFNIERHTMIGKLLLLDENGDQQIAQFDVSDWGGKVVHNKPAVVVNDEDNTDNDDAEFLDRYDAGKDFMDNYLTGDTLALGTKWFKLPTTEFLVEDFKRKHKKKDTKFIDFRGILRQFINLEEIGVEDEQ